MENDYQNYPKIICWYPPQRSFLAPFFVIFSEHPSLDAFWLIFGTLWAPFGLFLVPFWPIWLAVRLRFASFHCKKLLRLNVFGRLPVLDESLGWILLILVPLSFTANANASAVAGMRAAHLDSIFCMLWFLYVFYVCIRKAISTSGRIFWHRFQAFAQKHDFRLQMFRCLTIDFPTPENFEICSKQLRTMRNRLLMLQKA